MKIRFLGFLGAIAVGSAAVLIYASQSQQSSSNASLGDAHDCSACAMSEVASAPPVAATVAKTDDCCAAEATVKPAVATLATDGCPYVAGDTTVAAISAKPANVADEACCAAEATATNTVAAQIEK